MRVFIYLGLLIAICAYSLWRGGWPERLAAALFLFQTVAILATRELMGGHGFAELIVPDFLVDCVVLIGFLAIAVMADRFWPIAMVGLHGTVVAAHLARSVDASITSVAYGAMMAVWSYPMLALLALATLRHRRRMRERGYDLDWSRQTPGA
jgi:hypothetical protein